MKLYAISDLHLVNNPNRDALLNLPSHKKDWLILAGDIGETLEHLRFAFSILTTKFEQIVWVPGNHDLWTFPLNDKELKGEDKYHQLVDICKSYKVFTPEDEYPKVVSELRYLLFAHPGLTNWTIVIYACAVAFL